MRRPTKACPLLFRSSSRGMEVLLFRHELGDIQLVKGTIEPGEPPMETAIRELVEESGLVASGIQGDLGLWQMDEHRSVWAFYEMEVRAPVPETWAHLTADDGGRLYHFFWQNLDDPLPTPCDPYFRAAFEQVRLRKMASPA